jgi:hypothetical protein
MTLVEIPAGNFMMGRERPDCWDQQPIHKVTITHAFRISKSEVTVEQYKRFRPEAFVEARGGIACGMTWQDAADFCDWLSRKEAKPYRLPTEAEWEYACKSGQRLERMVEGLSGVQEWCLDWYGEYPAEEQRDPIGPANGLARIVRGGPLEEPSHGTKIEDYSGPDARCGLAPAFGIQPAVCQPGRIVNTNNAGHHQIGFRVVQAPLPETKPLTLAPPFARRFVKQSADGATLGPDPSKPYFIKRKVLPWPPDPDPKPASRKAIDAVGLPPSFRGHNHSPTMAVCPNGDLLMVTYTSYREYESGVSLIASRLRLGSDEWDMASPAVDFPGLNDHAPLLWNDGGRLWLFWGSAGYIPISFPFQWIISDDSGANWSAVHFPLFTNNIDEATKWNRQPINTVVRGRDGTIYVPCDAGGARSVLWSSPDEGKSWSDPGGRTFGRHTTCALLEDGSIMGLGGKNSTIGGYMPVALSTDGAKTWVEHKSPFPPLGGGQRPSLLRLRSGRLLVAGDWTLRKVDKSKPTKAEFQGKQGVYLALSEDEGKTWTIKTAPEVRHIGYSVLRQSPNGLVHLLLSMPMEEYTFNEAWVLDTKTNPVPEAELLKNTATTIRQVRQFNETWPNGKTKVAWSAGTGDDGRWLLHGTETWYYEGGARQYETHYELGRKTGEETLWTPDGRVEWQWRHNQGATSVWTQYWGNGLKKAESTWRNFQADGPARRWDRSGKLVSDVTFAAGKLRGE